MQLLESYLDQLFRQVLVSKYLINQHNFEPPFTKFEMNLTWSFGFGVPYANPSPKEVRNMFGILINSDVAATDIPNFFESI